jgi:hypothetical protein
MVEKDPFGDKLKDKERAEEDLYFAKRDRELVEKMRRGSDAGREAANRESGAEEEASKGSPEARREGIFGRFFRGSSPTQTR